MITELIVKSHIALSIKKALDGVSYLDPAVLKINGFATPTMRHLFSNLCHIDRLTYLEIGTLCGATFVSAFNNNPVHAIGVDNFTQPFDQTGVEGQLAENLSRFSPGVGGDVDFINHDCWKDPLFVVEHKPVDIYYYDGEHSYASQARALPAFFDKLADRFIHIVDDFQWDEVKAGTEDGLKSLVPYIKIEEEWHLNGERMHDDPIFWNGIAIYLCSKVKSPA